MRFTGGRLAQLGEHRVRNAGVGGSNPLPSTNLSLPEHSNCDESRDNYREERADDKKNPTHPARDVEKV